MVDLRSHIQQVLEIYRSSDEAVVPLPVAAALALHEVHGNPEGMVARLDYEAALNLTAAALSRIVPIYTLPPGASSPQKVAADVGRGRFRQGAEVYEGHDGTTAASLAVERADLPAATELMKSAGLPFRLEMVRRGGEGLTASSPRAAASAPRASRPPRSPGPGRT